MQQKTYELWLVCWTSLNELHQLYFVMLFKYDFKRIKCHNKVMTLVANFIILYFKQLYIYLLYIYLYANYILLS